MAKVTKLTHMELLEVLDYDPATGIFVWKVAKSNRVKVGVRAGVVHTPSGGRYIAVNGEKFMAHRLAWFYVNGSMPDRDIRPLDGNFDNCAISNLIEVSRVDLAHARQKASTNTSGYNGVSRAKGDKWQAKVTWNYKQVNLGGSFETAGAAGEVVARAYEMLSAATPGEDVSPIIEKIRLDVRRRSAWANVQKNFPDHRWASYEEFAVGVTEISARRYAMVAIDQTKPIGPGNARWALPVDAEFNTVTDRLAYRQARAESHKDHYRDRDFRKKYGISFADYSAMLEAQNGVCAICEKPEIKLQHGSVRLLSVDHDHKTGAVRGLLCGNCNMAIGYACDDVTVLEKAIGYLHKHAHREPQQLSPNRDWLLVATPGFGLN